MRLWAILIHKIFAASFSSSAKYTKQTNKNPSVITAQIFFASFYHILPTHTILRLVQKDTTGILPHQLLPSIKTTCPAIAESRVPVHHQTGSNLVPFVHGWPFFVWVPCTFPFRTWWINADLSCKSSKEISSSPSWFRRFTKNCDSRGVRKLNLSWYSIYLYKYIYIIIKCIIVK